VEASAAATRLLSFYKAGRIMYSGNKSLTGESDANDTDKKYLNRLVWEWKYEIHI